MSNQNEQGKTTEAFLMEAANKLFERFSVKLSESLQSLSDSFQAEMKRTIKVVIDEAINLSRNEKNAIIQKTLANFEVEKKEAVRQAVEKVVVNNENTSTEAPVSFRKRKTKKFEQQVNP